MENKQINNIQLIECPRDAMQGWSHFISTKNKIEYLNALLQVGFDTIDFGSFVSPKAIPQMADTKDVLKGLDMSQAKSKLLAIIANTRGAEDAVAFEQISYLGFPFSISETFQQRNTNSSIVDSFKVVEQIQSICINNNKHLVVYLSMGFGNPYGDLFNEEIINDWAEKIHSLGVNIISLADTVGIATPELVFKITQSIVSQLPTAEIGVHLHSSPEMMKSKVEAALKAGCKRFDSAIKGIGGCPMAGNTLVGNMDTEIMIDYFVEKGLSVNIDVKQLKHCADIADRIFL